MSIRAFRYVPIVFLTLGLILFSLFPISSSFSQGIDKPSALGIVLTSFSPNYFKDDMGHTIILGEVENTRSFPITGVKIWAGFYDDINEQPLESAIGTTVLDVIPPFSKSPYIIRSTSPNAAITSVSINLLGFNSATPKDESLTLNSEVSSIADTIKISGSITNDGSVSSSETKIHLFFVDVFQPPRILSLSTIELEEAIEPGSTIDFEFDEDYDTRSVSYTLFAESANYNSNVASVVITSPPPQPEPEPEPPGDDIIPPELLIPSDIQVSVNDQNGVEVEFSVKGIDNIDQIIIPICIPSSGSIFPVGETIVSCSVTDSSGNTDTDSFTVTVEFSEFVVPEWVKDVAGFWCNDEIDDASFVQAIQYLITSEVLIVPPTESGEDNSGESDEIPAWIKNNACWWSQGMITDGDFVNGLQYLIGQGIIRV